MIAVLSALLGLSGLAASVFLISENRRPQSTLAWLLVFFFLPGIGLIIYILFGRDWKAFSKQSKLLMQDLEPAAVPLLSPLVSRQDNEITELERQGSTYRKLMRLVRRNSYSALTTRNHAEIQQNASDCYSKLIADIEAARHSIHHQYFIWQSDEFANILKDILSAKVREARRSAHSVRSAGVPVDGAKIPEGNAGCRHSHGAHLLPLPPAHAQLS